MVFTRQLRRLPDDLLRNEPSPSTYIFEQSWILAISTMTLAARCESCFWICRNLCHLREICLLYHLALLEPDGNLSRLACNTQQLSLYGIPFQKERTRYLLTQSVMSLFSTVTKFLLTTGASTAAFQNWKNTDA